MAEKITLNFQVEEETYKDLYNESKRKGIPMARIVREIFNEWRSRKPSPVA